MGTNWRRGHDLDPVKSSLCAAIIVASLPLLGLSAEWPQWRGPNRDDIIREAALPAVWPKQAPPPVWRVLVGEGYSSPVVANGRLYIMVRENGDVETCLCLEAQTGKQIWKHSYSAPHELHPAARSAGKGPKSTTTVAGDRVYMLGVSGMFHCFEAATGRVLWKRDFATEFWGRKGEDGYDAWATYCGASASPLIEAGRVILPVGGPKAGAMTAFSTADGKILWRANGGATVADILDDRSSYASPIIAESAGLRQVVGFTGKRLAGFAADDGRLLWDYPVSVSYDQTIVTPVVWKEHVILCAEGNPTTALRMEKRGEKISPVVVWRNRDLQAYMTSPVIVDDHLYGVDEGGQMVCIDLTNGRTAWEHGSFGQYVSVLAVGKQLLVLRDEGKLHIVAAEPRAFRLVGELTVSEHGTIWAHPAVVGSRMYLKDKGHLICYDFAAKGAGASARPALPSR